jgi:UDP-N-acetylglucosamine 1-carboxyvinyltransferase
MGRIVVRGGRRLKGAIKISGAKNAALPIIAASLLTEEKVVLHNIPRLVDVNVMTELAHCIGAKVESLENTLCIRASKLKVKALSDNTLAKQVRTSTLFAAALLPHFKEIEMLLPGGCSIGTRGLDLHLLGLTRLSATVHIENGRLKARANELLASHVVFGYPSVGATENLMIAACLAKGTSVIENAAREPEIIDLANFLNSMGANINGLGTSCIKIKGVEELSGTDYTIMPDRIETGTYIVAAAITNGKISLQNTDVSVLKSVVSKLEEAGVEIKENHGDIYVTSHDKIRPLDIVTEVYPGFPTDMQPVVTPLLSIANGKSAIKETIFDNRFNHIQELRKMGSEIRVRGNTIFISGESHLKGALVKASDIRSGAALILAGLVAEGETEIDQANQILRGYEDPVLKLKNVGAQLYYLNN